MRAINASLMSRTDVTVGGGAGSSIRSTLSRTMASTTAVITADVTAGPLPPSIAATVPGIAAASAAIAGPSVSAGRHRTSAFTSRLCGRCGTRRVGTIDPAAARRTPSSATWPSHSTPAPTPARPWPPPTATSHPSASFTGMASASARMPLGSWYAGMELPPQRWSADRFQPGRQLVVGLRGRASASCPHHDPTRRPRRLQRYFARLDLAAVGRLGRQRHGRRWRDRATQPDDRLTKAVERLRQIGDDLIALAADQRARRGEVVLDVDDQAVEHDERRSLISVKAGEVVGRSTTVGDRPDRRFEFW